jgi:hypothetical protein
MSLRRALEALPDDRATRLAAREIVAFFDSHPNQPVAPERLVRATGVPPQRVEVIIKAFTEAFVVDCGTSSEAGCVFEPSAVLSLEVQRFLRSTTSTDTQLQRSVERFRDRYGSHR